MDNSVLTEYAYNSILDMILTGKIKPGDRVREDVIAEQIGVSRTPVREAVNQLSQNGFINYVKRKGLYCVDFTDKDLLDLLDLRLALEDLCYRKCIDLASDNDLKLLYTHIEEFQKLKEPERSAQHSHYDIQFHVLTAEIARSSRLVKYVQEVETTLLIARSNLRASGVAEKVIELSWQEHLKIVRAIEARDRALVGELNRLHIQLMKETQVFR